MNLDECLSQPLAAVRDDGFSARVALALLRRKQRRQTLVLGMGAASLISLMALLPLPLAGDAITLSLAATSFQPYLSLLAGGLVVAWALWPRPFHL